MQRQLGTTTVTIAGLALMIRSLLAMLLGGIVIEAMTERDRMHRSDFRTRADHVMQVDVPTERHERARRTSSSPASSAARA